MDESSLGLNNADISISKEKDTTYTTSNSFESQAPISESLQTHIINSIVTNLNDIIVENQQRLKNNKWKDNVFYLEQIPPISLENYIHHLLKYTNMNISTLILSIIYIDKFCEELKYVLNYNNIYRLLLTSVFISLKYNEDTIVNAKLYADIAGVCVEDLKMLEYLVCKKLDFQFYISSDLYQLYYNYLSK